MVDLVVGAHNRIVVEPPTLWRPETAPLAAAEGSALLLPGPWNSFTHPIPTLLGALHHARALEAGRVVVIGHDDPGKQAGQGRADFVRHVIAGDRDAWVALATNQASLLDVHGYLRFLDDHRGWNTGIESVDGADDDRSAVAVRGFQHECSWRYGEELLVDGICGLQTLGALFGVLTEEWQGWLTKHGLTVADAQQADIQYLAAPHGLQTNRGFDGSPGAALDLFVGEAAWMDAEELTAHSIYESEVLRLHPLRIPYEDGWETGVYTVITDLTAGEKTEPELYVLRSTDNRYEQRLLLPDNAVDTGLLELHYDGLPTDARFDLRVEIEDVGVFTLFEDLAYPDLHRQAIGELPERHE